MLMNKYLASGLILLAGILGGQTLSATETDAWDGTIVQYGKMREAIGEQQHQGRVLLSKLVERPHFFGVAALERLAGEAIIHDGNVTITRVDAEGRLESGETFPSDTQATLLIGAYVPSWTEHKVVKNVEPGKFDQYLADLAARAGLNVSEPFVFAAEGDFTKVRLHVIHGACPMHARLKKLELPKELRPFEADLDKVRGKIVGVFAKDAVGDITHPATSTHMHLLYKYPVTGKLVTGHVEQMGLLEGAVVRLPKSKAVDP
jgi:hypothetical protein